MNKRFVIFVGVIIVLLLSIFLYEKYKTHLDYLTIVPNSVVALKTREKKYYDFIKPANFGSFNPSSATAVVLKSYTDLTNNDPAKGIVPHSGVGTGVNKAGLTDYKLFIYNPGSDAFNIIGVTLEALPLNPETDNKISMTIGPKDVAPALIKPYNGDKISIPIENEIAFIGTTGFVLIRITLICDNVAARPLYIYFKNTSNNYSGIKIDKLTNTILIVNLFA